MGEFLDRIAPKELLREKLVRGVETKKTLKSRSTGLDSYGEDPGSWERTRVPELEETGHQSGRVPRHLETARPGDGRGRVCRVWSVYPSRFYLTTHFHGDVDPTGTL